MNYDLMYLSYMAAISAFNIPMDSETRILIKLDLLILKRETRV